MNITEVKKDLYKSKANAYFQRYDGTKAQLIYIVELFGKPYQFPIDAFQEKVLPFNEKTDDGNETILIPADDLKGADFEVEVKGSLLIRWIERAIERGTIICLTKEEDIPEGM